MKSRRLPNKKQEKLHSRLRNQDQEEWLLHALAESGKLLLICAHNDELGRDPTWTSRIRTEGGLKHQNENTKNIMEESFVQQFPQSDANAQIN